MYNYNFINNTNMYNLVELGRSNLRFINQAMKISQCCSSNSTNPFSYISKTNEISAGLELFERITQNYNKQEFGITHTIINNQTIKIQQIKIEEKPFCDLVHFKKIGNHKLPKILVVAPMSGHYATLCKGTVEGLLPYFDVYITDWKNARDIPLASGSFDMDDYINYCIEFFKKLGDNLNVLAVCQPSVPVIAAIAIMSKEKMSFIPKSMILIGGPIDARENPTEVNNFAEQKTMEWFKNNVISKVPSKYPGHLREVYPGFMQLSGFISMNMKKHIDEHMKLFQNLVSGDEDNVKKHKKFYNEYLSVMDLPAEYYLQTVKEIFQDYSLPKGEMVSRGRKVELSKISKTSLLVIEGELDDITGIGQTKAAINLCKNIPNENKQYICQEKVGHYGLFNGSKYLTQIVPKIKKFIYDIC